MMKITRKRIKLATIIACSVLCGLASLRSFFFAATHPQEIFGNLALGTLLLGLGLAIYRQYRWAMRLTAAIFLLMAILLPIGLFSPFFTGDYMAVGKEPPSVTQILLWLIPLEALLLLIVFIIDPRKKRTDHEQS